MRFGDERRLLRYAPMLAYTYRSAESAWHLYCGTVGTMVRSYGIPTVLYV